jgi:hypothetical protein
MVVVALGDPSVPVTSTGVVAAGAAWSCAEAQTGRSTHNANVGAIDRRRYAFFILFPVLDDSSAVCLQIV